MDRNKKYNSKILLFGEYSLIKNSNALAIPFPKFHGEWKYWKALESIHLRQMQLPQFAQYLKEKKIKGYQDQLFQKALKDGIYFLSNIPLGYGAGSSGALCAAVYDSFFDSKLKENNPLILKNIFAEMESFFHGASSGFDPLICYLNQAVLIQKKEYSILEKYKNVEGFFLIDTGKSRSTEPLVKIFLEKYKNIEYQKKCESELIPTVNVAIEAFLKKDAVSLFHYIHDISRFQYFNFQEMIPKKFKKYWEQGLKSSEFKIKLCGAGGGGFLLGFSKNISNTKKQFNDLEIIPI